MQERCKQERAGDPIAGDRLSRAWLCAPSRYGTISSLSGGIGKVRETRRDAGKKERRCGAKQAGIGKSLTRGRERARGGGERDGHGTASLEAYES